MHESRGGGEEGQIDAIERSTVGGDLVGIN